MRRLRDLCSVTTIAVLLALTAGCSQQPTSAPVDTRATDEKAIRGLAVNWANAAAAKDLEMTLSFYDDNASMFPPNAPIASTKDERRKAWAAFMATPGYALLIETAKVVAAKSSDLAYETGVYTFTVNDKQGKPVTTKGKYVVVWKKDIAGTWKAVADIFNADQ